MSHPLTDLAAPGVRALKPYQPGKSISELEREYGVHDIIKLASNENPLGPGPGVLEAIQAEMGDIARYPDAGGFELKQALARRHGVHADCITLGNGSNDVLVLLAEAFLQDTLEAVYSRYSFAVYMIAVQAVGATARIADPNPPGHAQPLGHDLAAMARLVTDKTRIVFVANPNNPTGTWVGAAELRALLDEMPPETLVVVDQAYREYMVDPDYPDCVEWLEHYPNLVVTQTFSKAFGLAGLRIGYSVSHPQIAEVLNRVRQPFNVNNLANVAALAALDDTEHLQRSVAMNNSERERLEAACERLGLDYVPSAGNFVLVDMGQPAGPVYESFLRRSIIVRPVGNYALPDHLRISVGTPEENSRLIATLEDLVVA